MAASGADRELDFHPGMGMRWEITRSTEDTSGELFESTHCYDAREPGPLVHVHPNTEDSFDVIEGSSRYASMGSGVRCTPARR